MTRKFKNAVSRLRKLQDAALAGKTECPSIDISLSFYNHKYPTGDYASVDVSVCIHNENNEMEKHLMFSMSDTRCYKVGSKYDNKDWSIEDILHEIAVAVDYPV